MELKIKKISEKYLKEAHKIYNYYVVNSYSNFEETRISIQDFHKKYLNIINNKLPYLVALYEKKVVGIAYLSKFREKSGYRFSFENTIYIHKNYTKQGIGSKLLQELLNISKKNKKIKIIIAVIGSIDSKGSLKIHQKLGFKKTGVLKKIGFKNKKWIDSYFLQRNL